MDVKSKFDMWCVSFYERSHHTNPVLSVYTRASERNAAIRAALDLQATFSQTGFVRLEVETASYKQEEEVCTPWNKLELP
jgi:hypothetical protein